MIFDSIHKLPGWQSAEV